MFESDSGNIFNSNSVNIFTRSQANMFTSDSSNKFNSAFANMFTSAWANMFTVVSAKYSPLANMLAFYQEYDLDPNFTKANDSNKKLKLINSAKTQQKLIVFQKLWKTLLTALFLNGSKTSREIF